MELRREITAFLRRSGMAPTRFGRLVMRDPGFYSRLVDCQPRKVTIQKVRKFIAEWRPA